MNHQSPASSRFTELSSEIARARTYMERTAGVLQQVAEGQWDDRLDDVGAEKLARRVRAMAETVRLTRAGAGGEYGDESPRWPVDESRELPLNRKERFWTGTVLPAIITTPLFLNLDLFLELCGLPGITVDRDSGPVELYTEYNLTESTFSEHDRAGLPGVPPGGDTPDLIILGQDDSGERWLLAVEAKMFHTPGPAALAAQLRRQKVVIDYLREAFEIAAETTQHLLLVPAGLRTGELPRVAWEQVLTAYDGVAPAYWTSLLHRALNQYEELRSAPAAGGVNADARLTGAQILAAHAEGTLDYGYVGRRGGLDGADFTADVESGRWREILYQVRAEPLDENPNWMHVQDFIARTAMHSSD